MKYLVTKLFVGKKGGVVFNPAQDAEVFDHYFSALRWLVKERSLSIRIGYDVDIEWNKTANKLGREWLLTMTETSHYGHSTIDLSRINMNGFH